MRLWSQGRGWLSSIGKDSFSGPVASLVSTTSKRGVQAPARGGEEFGDIWLVQNALCLHPARACCPSCPRAFAVPHLTSLPPEASAAGGNSPRAWQRSNSLTRESAQGKTSPCSPSTSSFSGSSEAAHHRQGRVVSSLPRQAKGLPARGHVPQGRPEWS